MSSGTPIVLADTSMKRQFTPLSPISARQDDPNSFQEKLLQELIDETPSVLPVREFLSSTTTLFSLGREIPVDIGGSQGFIDNPLVTNDGYLVIVETKLYRNPEATREVIAQTLQYGMAIGRMPVLELEARIKRGQNPALQCDENIRDCVTRVASEKSIPGLLADDFDEALELHLRRGEILLLVASDGIHVCVERLTLKWPPESRQYYAEFIEGSFSHAAARRCPGFVSVCGSAPKFCEMIVFTFRVEMWYRTLRYAWMGDIFARSLLPPGKTTPQSQICSHRPS